MELKTLHLRHGVKSREQWFMRRFATCWSGTEPHAKSRSNTLEDLRSLHAELVAPAMTYHLRARITRGQRAAISAAYRTNLYLERWRYITEAGLWCRGDLTRSRDPQYPVVFTRTYHTLLKHADVTFLPFFRPKS